MFADRTDAGRRLAKLLQGYRGHKDAIVLALPRGGVPVAHEVAQALDLPLDVFTVRKLGLPAWPEVAMGAIASGGALYLSDDALQLHGINRQQLEQVLAREERELARREQLYRQGRGPLQVAGRTVILVDDGLATGASMIAAVSAVRSLSPARIVVAVPVAPADARRRLGAAVDEFVCAEIPAHFDAVGRFYREFGQTSDEDVCALLAAGKP